MSPKLKLALGAVLSVLVNALVAYVAPVYQPAALALAGVVLGALGIKRPGDVSPAQVNAHPDPAPVASVNPVTKSVELFGVTN